MSDSSFLVVDQTARSESSLIQRLRRLGRVAVARSIVEASAQLSRFQPDVVFCEWRLSDGTVLDALHEFGQIGVAAKVIVVSNVASLDRVVPAIRHGAFDFLVKPVDFEKLRASVASAIRQGGGEDIRQDTDLEKTAAPEAIPVRVGMTWPQIEQTVIEWTLASCGQSVPAAARLLRLSPSTIYRKLDQFR